MAQDEVKFILTADDQASSKVKGVSSSLGDLKKTAAEASLAFAGIAAGGTLMINGWMTAALDAERTQNQLAAVLNSTKFAAGMTVKSVNDLSEALKKETGIDDDATTAAQSMLLTFTQIHKETFPEATKAALDMATAMGGGVAPTAEALRGTAIQLGKALNDPTVGLTALKKVGVTFTEAQKEQITVMQKSGDLMGAQKIILAELATEFGGSAAALNEGLGGAMRQAQNAADDLNKALGKALKPTFIAIGEEIGKLMDWFNALDPKTKDLIANTALVVTGFAALAGITLGLIALFNPVTIAVAAITAAVGALYLAWQTNFMGIQETVTSFSTWIQKTLQEIWAYVGPAVMGIVKEIQINFTALKNWITENWDTIKMVILVAWDEIQFAWNIFWDTFKGTFQVSWAVFSGLMQAGLKLMRGDWSGAWTAIKTTFNETLTAINKLVNAIIGDVVKFLKDTWAVVGGTINKDLIIPVTAAWKSFWEGLASIVNSIIDAIVATINRLIGSIQGILNQLNAAKNAVGGAIGSAGGAINSAAGFFQNVGASIAGRKASGGPVESGSSYLVGENGPEIVRMGGNGYVTPNEKLGGQTIVININGNISSADIAEEYANIMLRKFQLSSMAI